MRLYGVRRLGPAGLDAPATLEIAAAGAPADLDATGLVLSPGFFDLHAHLRDPGFPQKETLSSGTRSAAEGGFTQVLAMANTDPATDTPARLAALRDRALRMPIRVGFVGAVTLGLRGEALTDAAGLRQAGALALSDDGRHALSEKLLGEALARASAAGLPVFVHPLDERETDTRLGETIAIEEALRALESAPGARLHLQHVSTREGVDRLRAARAAGLAVTAEVTPHHLALTEDDVRAMGAAAQVNPPLRQPDDLAALRAALVDGSIDAIATDHAPHEADAKAAGAPGFHGFETALGLLLRLKIPWPVIHRSLVQRPREVVGLPVPEDDWILIDPAAEWSVSSGSFASRSRNTPVEGWTLVGRVVMTICRGRLVHRAEVAVG